MNERDGFVAASTEKGLTKGELFPFSAGGIPLVLKRISPSCAVSPPPRPLLLVPGYGMNSFIFGFHPTGRSLEAALAARGIEVWSLDMREQGRSRELSEKRGTTQTRYGLADLALADVPAAIDEVLRRTSTGHRQVDLLGCSLGAAIVFAYLAHHPDANVGTVVSHGGLVTWVDPPALLRLAFASPALVGLLPVRGSRALAGFALPALARHAPKLLSLYLRVESTRVADAKTMVQTVEDPSRFVNREIAEWVKKRKLTIRGIDVSEALRSMRRPLLVVMANQDGIVPPPTARALFDAYGGADKELLAVGSDAHPLAHADLFLSDGAEETIFGKIADFLLART